MATLQDVQDAITTHTAAVAAKAAAQSAIEAASNAALADVVAETATFAAAQAVYSTALSTAQANHDVPALLTAYNDSVLAAETALYTMRDVMQEFAGEIV